MEITFQLAKKDLVKFFKLYIKDRIRQKSVLIIVLILVSIFSLAGATTSWWRFLFALIASPLIVFGICYYLPLLITLMRFKFFAVNNKPYFEEKKLTVLPTGLEIESAGKTTIRKWESMKIASSNTEYIYIIFIDKKIFPIPKMAFSSESEAINFLGSIQSALFGLRGNTEFNGSRSVSKPGYAIGLLCLIPLLGAIAGIVFIVLGIFNYKDKWFVIIGAAGILWTVGIYSSLYYSTNTISFKKSFVPLAQQQLNSVMKAVEFYKIKDGTYPDSLEQINKDNSDISIWDPLQFSTKSKKSIDFNYKKVGDHYYLFSSGVDGIPNTKDDIYPQVAKSDSAKFGLIHK